MAYYSVSLRINELNRYGFADEFYLFGPGSDLENVRMKVGLLMQARLATLNRACVLLDARIHDVAIPGKTTIIPSNTPGALGGFFGLVGGPETPMVAAQVNMTTATAASREWLMRGLSDGDVIDGEFTMVQSGPRNFTRLLNLIANSGYYCLKKQGLGTPIEVNSVAGGLKMLTTSAPHGFVAKTLVQIKTRVAGEGCRISAILEATPMGVASLWIPKWRFGNTSGGTVTPVTYSYPVVTGATLNVPRNTKTRRTGGPFGLTVGKRSRAC